MRTCSASGLPIALCLVVSRLDKNELIMPDLELKESKGVFLLEIEGFSMHSNIDLLNNASSYIILMRRSKNEEHSADKEQCN